MTLADVLGAAASTGGVILAFAPIAQIRLVVARRSAEGISLGYWCVLMAAMTLWLAYGVAIGSAPIIVANTATITVAAVMVAVLVHYRPARAIAVPAAHEENVTDTPENRSTPWPPAASSH